jgi:hypothetical protein
MVWTAGLLVLFACSSFGSSKNDADPSKDGGTPDASANGDGGAAIDADSGKRFCGAQLPNTTCWDFDDRVAVTGTRVGDGSTVGVDEKIAASRPASLRAATPAAAKGAGTFRAYVSDSRAITLHVVVELKLRLDAPFDVGDVVEIAFERAPPSNHYQLQLAASGDTLRVRESTRLEDVEQSSFFRESQPFSITSNEFHHVVIDCALEKGGAVGETRRLTLTVDGQKKLEDTVAQEFDSVNPSQTLVSVGLTFVSAGDAATKAQSVHVDDVLVRWAP